MRTIRNKLSDKQTAKTLHSTHHILYFTMLQQKANSKSSKTTKLIKGAIVSFVVGVALLAASFYINVNANTESSEEIFQNYSSRTEKAGPELIRSFRTNVVLIGKSKSPHKFL